MGRKNSIIYKRTVMYSTIVTSLFLAIITLFKEYGISYINNDLPLSQKAKELSEEIELDKRNYINDVASKILSTDEHINTVIVSRFEPDKILPKEINRVFIIRDRELTDLQFRKKHSIRDITFISDMPIIYYSLLSSTEFVISDDVGGTFGIIKSTIKDDKNLIFGMYSYNSPSGWVGVIVDKNHDLSEDVFNKIKAYTYRINLILF